MNLGWGNVAYLCSAALAGYFVDFRIFVAMTSWVHYCKYIYQYYWRTARDKESYAAWKRDVLLFKTVALCNLGYIYLKPYVLNGFSGFPDIISLAMIAVGYYISIAATQALGIDGTYFGIELGHVKAEYTFVKDFPYNVIPHPMILGQVFALLGLFKPAHVHQDWPWVIPVHIALYLTHMTQEIYDFHNGVPWYEAVKKAEKKE
uniref:phosphatidyl-N-methylethanolamine N-methyltransferase n=1 Tax=Octactis speculum TaxID=3111310 RepID=A0A7S2DDC3_9STRA